MDFCSSFVLFAADCSETALLPASLAIIQHLWHLFYGWILNPFIKTVVICIGSRSLAEPVEYNCLSHKALQNTYTLIDLLRY
jgi:hypothetical protein